MIGSRLGVHEITAKLGEGGMGVVYRATDSRLKREVAIKVLPAAFTEDPERLARFEREAQLLAQLQHPNIASVYGFEHADDVRGLVMELVEGPTLAERLASGPAPLEDALAIAHQIAEALEAAHAKGIVHRDLKPANIKVSFDGKVKVLDFGLAKALDASGGGASSLPPAQSPTLTLGATMQGVVLGTAGYMAPEQAKGLPADKRADIWAFGVVLFEMLTGRVLFEGETVPEILAGVIRADIDLSRLPALTPASVRGVLRRCLERNPKNRLHDIADARILLDEAASDPAGDAVAVPATSASRRSSLVALVLAAALAVGLGAGWLLHRPASAPVLAGRGTVAMPSGTTYAPNELLGLAISRDGNLQAAVAVDGAGVRRIAVHSRDQFEARILPDTEGANVPFFSPDGQWIGFFRKMELCKIPVTGGAPVRLAQVSSNPRGGSWSRDGFIYFSPDAQSTLSRVPEGGGQVEAATKLDTAKGDRTHRWPDVLPDGRAVLFTVDDNRSTEYYDDARIEAVVPATGERTLVLEGASMARYAGGDRLVFARDGSLFAIHFDPRTLKTQGTPVQMVQGVATDVSTGAAAFSLAENGSVLWAPGGTVVPTRYVWVDWKGAETGAAIPTGPYSELALAADGKRAALIGGPSGTSDLWIADLERGSMIRLTNGSSTMRPVWSPDGARIAFTTRLAPGVTQWQLVSRLADGSRDAEVLATSERFLAPTGFTPDGRTLIYTQTANPGTNDLWTIGVAPRGGPQILLRDAFNKVGAVVSPDGRWLAYTSNEGGQAGVYVRPFPSGEGKWQISTPNGMAPRWSSDGHELFYIDDSKLQAVRIETAHGFSAGRPQTLFDRLWMGPCSYGVAPDGKRFFAIRAPENLGTLHALNLDLGFGQRLATMASASRE